MTLLKNKKQEENKDVAAGSHTCELIKKENLYKEILNRLQYYCKTGNLWQQKD